MLTEKMEMALNRQINEELASGYIYLSMAAWFQSENLPGFAHWMELQAQEELKHAMKIYGYVHERRGTVRLQPVPAPAEAWASPLAAFETAFAHEQHITSCINSLLEQAGQEKDHPTVSFLQWFVNEQVEEEASADEVVQRLRMIGDTPHALFMMDRMLGERAD